MALLVHLMMERWSGNFAAFCATLAMVGVATLRRRTRMSPRAVLDSLVSAGLTMAPLAVAIAGAGIVVSALTATGMVVAFGGIIRDLAGGSLPLLLLLFSAYFFVVTPVGLALLPLPRLTASSAICPTYQNVRYSPPSSPG